MRTMKILNSRFLQWGIIAGLLIYIFIYDGSRIEEIVLPPVKNEKTIVKPRVIIQYDTVYLKGKDGKTIEVVKEVENPVNNDLVNAYLMQRDSIEKLNLYMSAVTKREYSETLSDSIQDINVFSRVTGTLDYQKISYETKERSIDVKVKRKKPGLFLEGFATYNTNSDVIDPSLGVGLSLVNSKNIVRLGYDTNKTISAGLAVKMW